MADKPEGKARSRVARLLRHLRQDAGLSQRTLARQLGVAQQWVHQRETGAVRVDLCEFIDWVQGCGEDPRVWFAYLMDDGEASDA